jgi:AcrR family transcriptional regulator
VGLVLDAATRAFAEHGYQGASVGQFAERAGVVAAVIYDHVGSKRELYLELLAHHGQTLRPARPGQHHARCLWCATSSDHRSEPARGEATS